MLSTIVSVLFTFFMIITYHFVNNYYQFTSNIYIFIIIGSISLIISFIVIGLIIKRKAKKLMDYMQNIIQKGQVELNRKMQIFQQKPQGNMKIMQQILHRDKCKIIRNALEYTKHFNSLCKWSFIFNKQINSIRMQFHYHLKEFDKVDFLLPKCIYIESITVAMKIARQYVNNDDNYKKIFKKNIKKFKNEEKILLYGLYSWILVKKNDIRTAINILLEGKDKTGDSILTNNWNHLVNNNINRFSNSGLGDMWYSLYLEEPKIKASQSRKIVRRR